MTTWDRGLAGKKCDGPGGCGHALSRHNTLGYCRHTSKRDGDCICGDWRAEKRREYAGLDWRGPIGAGAPRQTEESTAAALLSTSGESGEGPEFICSVSPGGRRNTVLARGGDDEPLGYNHCGYCGTKLDW